MKHNKSSLFSLHVNLVTFKMPQALQASKFKTLLTPEALCTSPHKQFKKNHNKKVTQCPIHLKCSQAMFGVWSLRL